MKLTTKILENLLSNDEYRRAVLPHIKEIYFQSEPEKLVFSAIFDFVSSYNDAPSISTLLVEIENSKAPEKLHAEMKELVESFSNDPEKNQAWLMEQTEKWCQDRALYNGIMDSVQILNGKDNTKTKNAIPSILTDALSVSFDTKIGHEYLADADDRYAFYTSKEVHYPTDITFLNQVLDGGFSPKTLNCFMGVTGSGKSLVMCHIAASYLFQNRNVLYITCEMSDKRISQRIDANLLNIEMNRFKTISKKDFDDAIAGFRKISTGRVFVKEYPTSTAHVGHFRHLLDELRMKKSFVPEIVVVDYINICASSRLKLGVAGTNSYQMVKSIAEELRGLAVEKNLVIITATQTNREGFGSTEPGMQNTSESIGLPATLDTFFALITNDSLAELGQLKIKQLKNRFSDINDCKSFVVGVDKKHMRLFNVEQNAQTLGETPPEISDDVQAPKQKNPFSAFKSKPMKSAGLKF